MLNRRRLLQALGALVVLNPGESLYTLAAAEPVLQQQFADVPPSYRMFLHWYVFGPSWTVAEAARQMKLMKDAGAGGILIFPTYPVTVEDDPARGWETHPYLSPQFLEVLGSVVKEARRLGLGLDIVAGTGWPFGGPSVALEDAAKTIRHAKIPVADDGTVRLPSLNPGEKIVAIFLAEPGFKFTDVTEKVTGGGLELAARVGGEVQVFYAAPTRMQVKRPSVGAEGLVLDHYKPGALLRYLDHVGRKLLESAPPGSFRSIFCDSLEVYRTNWTEDFPKIFLEKRGYNLVAHLPALFEDAHPDSRDLRCDFWRTLSEQALDGFVRPLRKWAHAHGTLTQVEAYGTPPVSLAAYREVDIPAGEHYEWKEFNTSRWASSGAHLAGKRTIVAEAWTWLGLPNRFADSLEDLKRVSDLHFLSGLNALYGVTYAYSPVALGSPGWPPYFGPIVNHTQPFWPHFRQLADYVNRASFILQQGKPVADVALYLPAEDCMAEAGTEQLLLNWATRDRLSSNGPPPEFSLKNAMHYEADAVRGLITNGYSFDGVDRFVFPDMRVESGRLRLGDGDYCLLVLPNLRGIDVESLEKIAAFVRGGGMVIATRRLPETAYGMKERERNRTRVRSLAAELFGAPAPGESYRAHSYASGKAIFCEDEKGSYLKALRELLPPDILLTHSGEHVSFVHRRTPDRDFYFLANTSAEEQILEGTFRVGRKYPELWDPRTGTISSAAYRHNAAGTLVPLRLGPYASMVVAFSSHPSTAPADEIVVENGRYAFGEVEGLPAPRLLAPRWRLSFPGSAIPPVDMEELQSWTEIPQARFYSGMGVYEAQFDLPATLARNDLGVWLDLGRVRETAEVRLNERSLGVAWMRPYRLEAGGALRAGMNRLRVGVTNLLINKVLGQGKMDYSAVIAKYGNRFPRGDEWDLVREPFVSGLLGPVRLVFYKKFRVKR